MTRNVEKGTRGHKRHDSLLTLGRTDSEEKRTCLFFKLFAQPFFGNFLHSVGQQTDVYSLRTVRLLLSMTTQSISPTTQIGITEDIGKPKEGLIRLALGCAQYKIDCFNSHHGAAVQQTAYTTYYNRYITTSRQSISNENA